MPTSSPSQKNPISCAEVEHFFQDALLRFQHVVEQSEEHIERYYTIAGITLCLRFANADIVAPVTTALEHVASLPIPSPDMTICVWDTLSSEVFLPTTSWFNGISIDDNALHAIPSCHIKIASSMPGIVSLFDVQQRLGICYIASYAIKPPNAVIHWIAAPMHDLLHWGMRCFQRYMVRGGAVGLCNGGVLLVGSSGSGKSTTVLASLQSPLLFAGDDYVVIHHETALWISHLYNSAKISPEHISHLPHVESSVWNRNRLNQLKTDKAYMFLSHKFSDKMSKGFPLRALLVTSVTDGEETIIHPMSPEAVLPILTQNAIHHTTNDEIPEQELLRHLVPHIPSYRFEIGTDIARIPETILNLLAS